jgi:predicted nucleotidyltransferase
VTITQVATQKHYQANPASPLYAELCGIVQKTVGLREPVAEALAPLAQKIDIAFIYGSVAGGSDRADSDIDLMVISDKVRLEELVGVLSSVEARLGRSINPTLFATSEFADRRERQGGFVARVLEGPTISLIGRVSDD